MNDRELVAKLEAMARYTAFSPQEAEACRAASRRIAELGSEVADDLEEKIANRVIVRDAVTGWRTIERCNHGTVNAARELVRMGLWEENTSLDDIEHVEFRPVKGTP